ncbi:MAG: hypothetical protein JO345_23845 [Streptosporangiaceae bacterium]|nr:hypothetical protein [Streptosporangiaceae bacterium]
MTTAAFAPMFRPYGAAGVVTLALFAQPAAGTRPTTRAWARARSAWAWRPGTSATPARSCSPRR